MPSPSSADYADPPGVELAGAGPGDELVAHLEAVLDGLDGLAPGHRLDAVEDGASWGSPAPTELVPLFEAQAASRWLDVAARRMRALDQGFYTIGSAGPRGERGRRAAALRPTDPALLHYRSGGFYLPARTQAGRPPDAGLLTCCSGSPRPPTTRSPAAGTRCSATPTWR